MRLEVFFVEAPDGPTRQRFCIHHTPADPTSVRGAFVYVHPFAEELNKSRRMASLQARALARAGHAVLQIDLLGCGDSGGTFADATWDAWVGDVLLAMNWMRSRYQAPLWLWGLRLGCLLATEAASRADGRANLLFWQPVVSGQTALSQFLRLRSAAGLVGEAPRAGQTDPRKELAAGQVVDIAGYAVAPALALGLEGARLELSADAGRCVWLETSTREPPALLPQGKVLIQRWQDEGRAVTARAVAGPAFWQTQEIEDAPALISATMEALDTAEVSA